MDAMMTNDDVSKCDDDDYDDDDYDDDERTTKSSSPPFRDASTECAICLQPLSEGECIELTCGHVWHLECLSEQLEHARPSHTKRLLFSGCRCAKCGAYCDHERLKHLTRTTDVLRDKVDRLIAEQLRIDSPQLWKAAFESSPSSSSYRSTEEEKTRLIEEGRRMYAFYLCHSCDEPYFGGTAECADLEGGELRGNDMGLCQGCSPQIQTECRHALEHRGSHLWKCRYCCRPANHVCYGTVHFCEACHDRNSDRVRQEQFQRQRQRRRWRREAGVGRGRGMNNTDGTSDSRPPLDAIPCPGGDDCPYPKPRGRSHHQNGASSSCEQVYHCVLCQSSSAEATMTRTPGSRNFINNPSGAFGMDHWSQFNRRMRWMVEASRFPPSGDTETNFVSSYEWCIMGQRVPLHRYVQDPSAARIEVSAKFMARTDCPSLFRMEAILLSREGNHILRQDTGILEAPADSWERASIILEPTPSAHSVFMIVHGKDRRFWQGRFGSKVAECSVRVLSPSESDLEDILLPGELQMMTDRH